MAYFLGFIVGLLIGPISIAGRGNVTSTLLVDVLLLCIVVSGDFFGGRLTPPQCTPGIQQPVGERVMSEPVLFWRLTAAFATSTIAQEGKVLIPWPMVGILSLATLGGGAGLFEILVLALLGRIRSGGSGAVALAFGIVATIAAVALFLMTLAGHHSSSWVATSVLGFALTAWLVRDVNPLTSSADIRKETLQR